MRRNSMRLVAFIPHAGVGRDPVSFPGLAPNIRESCSERHEFGVISDRTNQAEGLMQSDAKVGRGCAAFVFRFYVQERVDRALAKPGLSRKMCQSTSGIVNVADGIQLIKLKLEMSPSKASHILLRRRCHPR